MVPAPGRWPGRVTPDELVEVFVDTPLDTADAIIETWAG